MKFFGVYDTKPHDDNPDVYDFQQDYGFLRDDGLLIISATGTPTDAASIPRFAWPIVGHPMMGMNKYWSAGHDSLYAKTAVILDTNTLALDTKTAFKNWRDLEPKHFIHQTCFNKKFADNTLLQAMRTLDEPWIKQKICYASVRIGGRGWWS